MPADAVAPSAATSELRFSDIACEFRAGDGGEVLWRDQHCRVVYVESAIRKALAQRRAKSGSMRRKSKT